MTANNILVVDDEIGIRELLSEILKDEGYNVRAAENAATARAMRREARPDLVLLDIQLPGIDGFEVLRRLRAEASLAATTIVALSANAMPEDVNRARVAGFDDYWTKPIDFHAFLRALTLLVQKHLH